MNSIMVPMLLLLLEMILLVSSEDSVQIASFRKARKIKNGPGMCAVDVPNSTKTSSSLQDCSLDCTRDGTCASFNIKNYHICDVYNYKPRIIAPVAGCSNYQVTKQPHRVVILFRRASNSYFVILQTDELV